MKRSAPGTRPVWMAALLLSLAGVRTSAAPQERPDRLRVIVSILPQVYFVERIGGPHVQVEPLVGAGQSPHIYEPTPRQLESLARAKLYFTIGIDFETPLLPRIRDRFRNVAIVDTRAGVPLRYLSADELAAEAAHAHGPGAQDDGHEHQDKKPTGTKPGDPAAAGSHAEPAGLPDPHVWLNPLYVKIQARTIADALIAADPPNAEDYRRNLAAFSTDLDRLHQQTSAALAPLRGKAVYVFHPAFGYFTDAYGLRQVPVEMGGKEPSARHLAALIRRARDEGVRAIFVQPQYPTKAAETVARAIGAVVIQIDDLPQDYIKSLEDTAAKVRSALAAPAQNTK
ncbi:MAG: zinc ABC transporter substrate-binding protein [Planctomycetota bacterium]